MLLTGRLAIVAFLAACLLHGLTASGQGACTNTTEFPFDFPTTPDPGGALTTISTCSYESEYSVVTGIVAGAAYQFTLGTGNYITVRQGTYDGPILAEGYSPVTAIAADATDIFAHWNVDETCATMSGTCIVTTVQLFLNCIPPTVSAVFNENCDLQEFTVEVNITDTGDSSIVNIAYNTSGGPVVISGVSVGTTTLGPFLFGDFIDIIIEHETDPACNVNLGHFEATGDCPVTVSCGGAPEPVTYCYGNNVQEIWNYVSTGTGSLVLTFISGTIENSNLDQLFIYDGTDNTGPILFQHTAFSTFDLAGLVLPSTTGAIHMELYTDGFGSCADGTQTEWNWQVQCLDCFLPQATASSIDDCPNNQFSIVVDITDVGDGGTVDILYTVNGGAVQTVSGLGAGITNLGPFTVNDIVSIQVNHGTNPACNIDLGTHTDQDTCPNLITCGAPPLVETYCYQPNDFQDWLYTAVGSGTLRLQFHIGTIEPNFYDILNIYDGVDASGTLLFSHGDLTTNLGPEGSAINGINYPYETVSVYSATGSLYMEMSSDGVVQCGGEFPTTDFDSWEWDVVCLDCSIPVADITVVDSCATEMFYLDVNITSTGSGATAALDYTVNGGPVQNLAGLNIGITTLGPFAFDENVNVTLVHETNSLCNIPMGDFTDTGTCPELIDCGTEVDVTYCHGENEDAVFYYQGTGTYPLALFFNGGELEECCDRLFVYDGPDITAPELTPVGGALGDLTGQFYASTNPGHSLTVRVTTDGSVSCQSGAQAELDWTVSCLDCVPPTASFNIVQDCENFQYFIDVVVDSLGSDNQMEILNTAGLPADTITAPGTYQIGPFVSGTQVQITVQNDANSLCNVYSDVLVNPLCPNILCGGTPLIETYCYTDLENRAWAYEAPTPGATIQLAFIRGTIESNTWDDLIIYDGPDATGPVLFTHGGTSSNLGPDGSAILGVPYIYETVNVTTTTGNLYMTLTSDGSVNCSGNFPAADYDPWEWSVQCIGCAAPGVSYNTVADCRHRIYKTEVIVTQAPDSLGLEVVDMINGDTILVTATGVYEFGPFPVDGPSLFAVTDLVSPNCTYFSDTLTYLSDSCVIRSCGFDYYTYCYENDEDRWYTFQSLENVPTTISFTQGQLLSNDRITLYNGFDETAALIYQGSNGGNLTGFEVNSQNPDNAITLHIESNDVGSCETGEATVEMNWIVGCGAVGMDEFAADGFSVFPNPTQGNLFVELGSKVHGNVRLRVMDMSGRIVLDDPFMVQAGGRRTIDLRGLQSGQYMVQLTTENWVKTQRVQLTR